MIARVRRFNRIVTQRVGALNDQYLARARSLGAARVLWEIGETGRDVRSLRATLELDSGYLSRLLRSLEGDGLITVDRHRSDGRVRTARLTAIGATEVATLDGLSDDLAASFLEPLSTAQRDALVAAMVEVERLLTAAMVEIAPSDPDHPDAQQCLRAFYAEIDERFDSGFDPALGLSAEGDELRPPNGLFLVARLHGEPVGCGALLFHDGEPPHIKRMWVSDSVRGLGVGRRLLTELERHAAEQGSAAIRLETNQSLTEAVGLYRSSGYAEVEAFNDERYAHHWFEKRLGDHRRET